MRSDQSITERLSHLILNTPFDVIPARTVEKAAHCILDTVGCALGATQEKTNQRILQRMASISNPSELQSSNDHSGFAWGQAGYLHLLPGTLFNGVLSHTLELDDVHRNSKVPAGAVVVPAALTLGKFIGSDGRQVLRAVVIGYEIALRLGEAIGMREHRLRGWHCTSTMGVFGAAAASAVLLGLSGSVMTSALGLAGTHTSGLWTFLGDRSTHKRLHAGKAAHDGLLAAQLASAGLQGPTHILECEDGGVFRSMSAGAQNELVTESWGSAFRIDDVSFKVYAACRSTHPVIESLLALRSEHDLSLQQVKRVEIDTYRFAKLQCDRESWPQSSQEAKFNFRFAVSVVLQDGAAFIHQFSAKRAQDAELHAHAPEVLVRMTEDFESRYPMEWGCRVRVLLKNDRVIAKTVRFPKGDPQNPLDPAEVREKFFSLARITLPDDRSLELYQSLMNLMQIADVRTLPL